ncbi:MAG: hypothetical protein N2749_03920 [Clostridia bacterium]|nr:hypothetical protein [Clostridia bacterium]
MRIVNFRYIDFNINIKNSKKGVSLVVLIITIIAAIILITAAIIQTRSSIAQATLTSFATDLSKIQDLTNEFYINHGTFPVPDSSSSSLNQSQVTNMVDSRYRNNFIYELSSNGDYYDDSNLGTFYEIDLGKINIKTTVAGAKTLGQNDVYVVSYPSMKVYYLLGLNVQNNVYFSLSNKLNIAQSVKIENNQNIQNKTANLSILKLANSWTNTMPIKFEASLVSSEKVYIMLSGVQTEKEVFGMQEGNNIRNFNLSSLLSDNKDSQGNDILISPFTSEEIAAFNNVEYTKRYITIIIKNGGITKQTIKSDLVNYDNTPPVLSDSDIVSSSDKNTVKFIVSDDSSNIKSIKYDYLTKSNESGSGELPYYNNVSSLDKEYLNEYGKVASYISEGVYSIDLPKNIKSISVLISDNSGNWTKIDGFEVY